MKRYLIIGAGAAGISAAETIRELDPSGEIMVFSAEQEGYYSRPALAYYLSREITRKNLFPIFKRDFLKNRIDLRHHAIIDILSEEKLIYDDHGNRFPYDKLLIATGAEAVKPQIKGKELDGVVYLDSLAQTDKIIRKARRSKKAVVSGGGITALEIVEGLLARGVEVHFLLRKEHYWSRVLDPQESEIILKRLQHEGVIIHRNIELISILGEKGKVAGVTLSDGTRIKAGLAAFAIGVRPRQDLFQTEGLDYQKGIKVNQYMETSLKNIYAAGDVAEIYDPLGQSWVVDSLWPIARQQGITAGKNMVGQSSAYVRRSPMNVTRLAGLTTTIIGQVGSPDQESDFHIVRGESESWQLMPDAVVCQNDYEINRLRLIIGKEHLLGAVLVGDQSLSPILEDMIASRISITAIRDELIDPGANLAKILIDYYSDREDP